LRDMAIYEKMLRENPAEYWKPHNQAAYLDAITRSQAVGDMVADAIAGAPPTPAAQPVAVPSRAPAPGAPAGRTVQITPALDRAPAPAAPAGATYADRRQSWAGVTVTPAQD